VAECELTICCALFCTTLSLCSTQQQSKTHAVTQPTNSTAGTATATAATSATMAAATAGATTSATAVAASGTTGTGASGTNSSSGMKGAFDPTAASLRLQALQKQQALDVAAQQAAVTQRQALQQQDLLSTKMASGVTVNGVTATNDSSTATAAQVRIKLCLPIMLYEDIVHFDVYFSTEKYVDTGLSALSSAGFARIHH
jgi:hypothetical protein